MIKLTSPLLEAFDELDALQEDFEEYKSAYLSSPHQFGFADSLVWYNGSKYDTLAVSVRPETGEVYWSSINEARYQATLQFGRSVDDYYKTVLDKPYVLVDFDFFHKCWDCFLEPLGLLRIFKADGTFKHAAVYGAIKEIYFGKGYNKPRGARRRDECYAVNKLLEMWEVVYKYIPAHPELKVAHSIGLKDEIAATPENQAKIKALKAEHDAEQARRRAEQEERTKQYNAEQERRRAEQERRDAEAAKQAAERKAAALNAQKSRSITSFITPSFENYIVYIEDATGRIVCTRDEHVSAGSGYTPILCCKSYSVESHSTRVDDHYYRHVSYNSAYADKLDKYIPKENGETFMDYETVTEYTTQPDVVDYWGGNDFDTWVYADHVKTATD